MVSLLHRATIKNRDAQKKRTRSEEPDQIFHTQTNRTRIMVPRSSEPFRFLVLFLIMVALWNRADHYVFVLWFFSTFLWSPYVIGQTIIFLPCDFYLSFFFFSFLA